MDAERTWRLMIAETDPALRRIISRRFVREGFEVVEVDAPEVLGEKLDAVRPDLVIVEVGGVIAPDLIAALREASEVPLIATVWQDDVTDEAAVLDLGADDCVVRPLSLRTLMARVRAVLRRARPEIARQLHVGDVDIDLVGRTVTVRGGVVDLPPREYDLLAFLATHPGEVFTREKLLVSVWHSSPEWQQQDTVTEHIHRLRLRIEEDAGNPRLIVTVRGIGYRLVGSSEASRSSITSMTPPADFRTARGGAATRQSMA
jgi:two-component system alkaline phosphatase synthesis response regulator PhoP